MACSTEEGVLPTKPAPSVKPPGLSLAASTLERQDTELIAAGRELAEDLVASSADEFSSPVERRFAERTARRRQRAEARDLSRPGGARVPHSRVATAAGTSMLRASRPAVLVAVIAGGVLGMVLGALSVGGGVIGLLVAGLTVFVLRAFGSYSGSTRAGAA